MINIANLKSGIEEKVGQKTALFDWPLGRLASCNSKKVLSKTLFDWLNSICVFQILCALFHNIQ